MNGRGERIRTSGLLVPNKEQSYNQQLSSGNRHCSRFPYIASFQSLAPPLNNETRNREQRFYVGCGHSIGHTGSVSDRAEFL